MGKKTKQKYRTMPNFSLPKIPNHTSFWSTHHYWHEKHIGTQIFKNIISVDALVSKSIFLYLNINE